MNRAARALLAGLLLTGATATGVVPGAAPASAAAPDYRATQTLERTFATGEREVTVDERRVTVTVDRTTELRGRELAASCAALGVTAHAYLGDDARPYRDSGMRWVRPGLAGPAADRDPDALTARPEAEAVADLTRAIGRWDVDAVVGYDDGGSYGHPDHVRMHHVTRAACAAVAVPLVQVRSESTYAHALADPPVPPPSAGAGTFVNLPHTLPALTRALSSYASQIELAGPLELGDLRGVRIRHVGGQVQDIWCGFAPQDAPGRGQWGQSPQR